MKLFKHTAKNPKKPASKAGKVLKHVSEDPYIDWAIILVIFFALLLSSVVVAYLDYDDVVSIITAAPPAATAPHALFDDATLTKVLKQADSRTAERSDITHGYSGPGDPSI